MNYTMPLLRRLLNHIQTVAFESWIAFIASTAAAAAGGLRDASQHGRGKSHIGCGATRMSVVQKGLIRA